MSFTNLGLRAEILRAVDAQGYSRPTPIQAQAIPVVLAGRDLMACAQTGTGKTAGFTLPILHRLAGQAGNPLARSLTPPRALILTPTRELAAQVEESVRTYGAHLPLKSLAMFGGVGINPQIAALKRGVDILVATPGRLLDHASQRTVNLSGVEILVLDEADRMLDMGFIRDIRKILGMLPPKRQNLLFSATFSDEIRSLAHGFLREPAQVEAARRNATAERISQRIYWVDKSRKRDLLIDLIRDRGWYQALVFTRTKHGANALAEKLVKAGIEAAAIHGNKSQSARTRALGDFKSGKLHVLVATDIAARGLDIDELPVVVNFELPNVPEDYVHRIGRTARAGSSGEAVSLVDAEERKLLRDIERVIGSSADIEKIALPGYEPTESTPREKPAAQEAKPRGRSDGNPRRNLARGAGGADPRRSARSPGSQPAHRSGTRHR